MGELPLWLSQTTDKMYKTLIVFVAAIIACHAAPSESKQGSFNRYFAYNVNNARQPVELDVSDMTKVKEVILPTRNTTVIIHGHRGSATTSLNPTVKDAFLRSENINVIVLDWSVSASQSYDFAAGAVPSVASSLANVITELVGAECVSLDKLHIVGFDLGAHVAGYTGKLLNGNVARITGLSPAARNWGSNSNRLNKNDALYVEVIHTDSGGLLGNGIGDAIGDVDFYVNGGSGQPGCFANNLCSHNRSWEVFAATLTHNHLIGNQCGNMLQVSLNTCRGYTLSMGNNAFNKLGSGLFRVNTRRTYPF